MDKYLVVTGHLAWKNSTCRFWHMVKICCTITNTVVGKQDGQFMFVLGTEMTRG